MNVEARFEVARRDDSLTVPVTALRTEARHPDDGGDLGIGGERVARETRAAGLEPSRAPSARLRPRECRRPERQLLGRRRTKGNL